MAGGVTGSSTDGRKRNSSKVTRKSQEKTFTRSGKRRNGKRRNSERGDTKSGNKSHSRGTRRTVAGVGGLKQETWEYSRKGKRRGRETDSWGMLAFCCCDRCLRAVTCKERRFILAHRLESQSTMAGPVGFVPEQSVCG